jgi:hypothetical protein
LKYFSHFHLFFIPPTVEEKLNKFHINQIEKEREQEYHKMTKTNEIRPRRKIKTTTDLWPPNEKRFQSPDDV